MSSPIQTTATQHRRTRQDVCDSIRERIVSSVYQPGELMPGCEELAAELTTSHVTVLRALDILKEEGFVCSRRGHGTFVTEKPPHLYECALLLGRGCQEDDAFQSRFYRTLAREVDAWNQHPRPWRIRVWWGLSPTLSSESARQLAESVDNGSIAGLIYLVASDDYRGTPLMDKPGVARVSLSRTLTHSTEMATVEIDAQAYLDRALTALALEGRRRVAILIPPAVFTWESCDQSRDRVLNLVKRHGLEIKPHWILQIHGLQEDAARQYTRLLFDRPADQRPDSLVLFDDHLVGPATRSVLEAGIDVPRELGVIAYNNFPDRPEASVLVRRLGFDCHELLSRLVAAVDRQRRTGKAIHERIQPLFEEELPEHSQVKGVHRAVQIVRRET